MRTGRGRLVAAVALALVLAGAMVGAFSFNGGTGTDLQATDVTVTEGETTDPVAAIGAKGYATLAAAIAECTTEGTTIVLIKDIAEGIFYISDGSYVTIDLNSHTISNTDYVFILSHGTLKLTGQGTVAETVADGHAPVVITGSSSSTDKNYSNLIVDSEVTLRGWAGIFVRSTDYTAYGVTVDFYGKIISPAYSEHTVTGHGIYVNGEIKDTVNYPEITLNEGSSIESGAEGIYAAGYAKWTINGGTITGVDSAIEIRAGILNITGGEFTCTSTGTPTWTYNGSGATVSGAVLAVSEHTTNLNLEVNVSGGTFNGPVAIWQVNTGGSITATPTITVTGGTFVGTYCATDPTYSAVIIGDGTAKISGGTYSDGSVLAYLADSATVGITLQADIVQTFNIPSGATVSLDLNGHKLTNTAGYHTIVNGGTLTIDDSSTGGTGSVDNVTHQRGALYNKANATATLNGGSFTRTLENGKSSSSSGGNSWYNILNHGTTTINEGVTVVQDGGFSSMIANGWGNAADDMFSDEASSMFTDSTLIIYGGTFSGGLNTVKNDECGTLTIHGGEFYNISQAAILNWNVATINGGTFKINEDSKYAVILNGYYYNSDVGKDTGLGYLYINGGTFTGNVIIGKMEKIEDALKSVLIRGGTFNGALTIGASSEATSDIKVDGSLTIESGCVLSFTGGWSLALVSGTTFSGTVIMGDNSVSGEFSAGTDVVFSAVASESLTVTGTLTDTGAETDVTVKGDSLVLGVTLGTDVTLAIEALESGNSTITFSGFTSSVKGQITGLENVTPSYEGTVVSPDLVLYTVTLEANYGSVSPSVIYIYYGQSAAVSASGSTVTVGTTSATATAPSSSSYTYSFSSWTLDGAAITSESAITGDSAITATFTRTAVPATTYTITWANYDGTVLQTQSLAAGAMPSYTGATPTRAYTATTAYTFAGWSPTVTAVTGNATYTATYTETALGGTISFSSQSVTVPMAQTVTVTIAVTGTLSPSDVSVSVGDTSVATVSSSAGTSSVTVIVSGISMGSTTVTATCGTESASMSVTVTRIVEETEETIENEDGSVTNTTTVVEEEADGTTVTTVSSETVKNGATI
ncbi:MAG: hypothetical protein Q4Q62_07475, partial [Thermoplasmata archaeon]|nr:hypothetical protein [Thermoplasmata archaeon]